MNTTLFAVLLLVFLAKVETQSSNGFVPPICPSDFNSFANTQQVVAFHYHLDLEVSFTRRALIGSVHIDLQSKAERLKTITLDSQGLIFKKINLHVHGKEHEIHDYVVSTTENVVAQGYPQDYGQPLTITIPSHIYLRNADKFVLSIKYETTNSCDAIQW